MVLTGPMRILSFPSRAPAAPRAVPSLLRALALVAALGLGFAATAHAQDAALGTAAPEAAADAPAPSASLETLIEVLRDDAARERLLADLEAAVASAAETAEPAAEAEAEAETPSLGRRLAETTQAAAQATAERVADVGRGLARARTILSRFDATTWATITDAARDLLLVIVVTAGTFLLLRRLVAPLFRRAGRYATTHGPLLALGAGTFAVGIDVVIVLVAWAVGYALTTTIFGEFGQIGLRQTLYLNAFLIVELVKVAGRAILSPVTADLRVLPVSDLAARRGSRVTAIVVSLLGYGQLLVVPIVNSAAGFFAGRSVAAVISCLAVLYLVAAVLRYRRSVGEWLVARLLPWRTVPAAPVEGTAGAPESGDGAEAPSPETVRVPGNGPLATILKLWWLPAIGFLVYVLYEALTRPIEAVVGTLLSTLQVAAAIIAGILISRFVSGLMARAVRLPADINHKIPLLEARINALVPNVLAGIRVLVILAVLAYSVETVGLVAAWSWLGSEAGGRLVGTVVVVGLILVIAYAIWVAFSSWVDWRLNPEAGEPPSSREMTLLTLLRNAVTVALIILTLMFTLSELGLNIGPLIASAGVLGLAIGFGAQKMVQDIITGVFIQFENAINVGDVVTVGGITGGVEKLTVRSVTLRDLQGVVHIIPFSSVDMVSNYTREFSFYVLDMGIAYRENVDEAKQALFDAYDELRHDPEQGAFLLGDLEYFGLDAFGDSSVVLRCRIKTWPGKQWGVGRAYNRLVKRIFDERGIEIPFPHTTLVFGESKDGSTQPIRIAPLPGAASAGGGPVEPGRGRPTDDAPLGDGED